MSATIHKVLEQIIDEGDRITVQDIMYFLEDGEALAKFDITDEQDVEYAYSVCERYMAGTLKKGVSMTEEECLIYGLGILDHEDAVDHEFTSEACYAIARRV